MKYFEENKVYGYEEIKSKLDTAQVQLMDDLAKEQKMLDDSTTEMVLTLHMMAVLTSYKALLLKGAEKDNG